MGNQIYALKIWELRLSYFLLLEENSLLNIRSRYLQRAQLSLLSHSSTLVRSPELQSIQF